MTEWTPEKKKARATLLRPSPVSDWRLSVVQALRTTSQAGRWS